MCKILVCFILTSDTISGNAIPIINSFCTEFFLIENYSIHPLINSSGECSSLIRCLVAMVYRWDCQTVKNYLGQRRNISNSPQSLFKTFTNMLPFGEVNFSSYRKS